MYREVCLTCSTSFNLVDLQGRSYDFHPLWEKWALKLSHVCRVTEAGVAHLLPAALPCLHLLRETGNFFIFYYTQVHWNKLTSLFIQTWWTKHAILSQMTYLSPNIKWFCVPQMRIEKWHVFVSGFPWQHVTNDFPFVTLDPWGRSRTSFNN